MGLVWLHVSAGGNLVLYADRCPESYTDTETGCEHLDHRRVNVSDEIEERVHVAKWFTLTRNNDRVFHYSDLSDSVKVELDRIVDAYLRLKDPDSWRKGGGLDFVAWAIDIDPSALPHTRTGDAIRLRILETNGVWTEWLVAKGHDTAVNPFTIEMPVAVVAGDSGGAEAWTVPRRCPRCGSGDMDVSPDGKVKFCLSCGVEWQGRR